MQGWKERFDHLIVISEPTTLRVSDEGVRDVFRGQVQIKKSQPEWFDVNGVLLSGAQLRTLPQWEEWEAGCGDTLRELARQLLAERPPNNTLHAADRIILDCWEDLLK